MTPISSSARKTELLLKQTRRHFPRFDDETVEITPIEKGGSDRRFYRVRTGPENTLILVKYNLERAENRLYVRVAEFLADNGIRAPKIYFHEYLDRRTKKVRTEIVDGQQRITTIEDFLGDKPRNSDSQ